MRLVIVDDSGTIHEVEEALQDYDLSKSFAASEIVQAIQRTQVAIAYAEYVEAKQELGETPLDVKSWQDFNAAVTQEDVSPIPEADTTSSEIITGEW